MLNHEIRGNISLSDGYCIVWKQSATVKNVEISLIHWRMSKLVVVYKISSYVALSRILGQIILFDKKNPRTLECYGC